jgi:hypothetical protein
MRFGYLQLNPLNFLAVGIDKAKSMNNETGLIVFDNLYCLSQVPDIVMAVTHNCYDHKLLPFKLMLLHHENGIHINRDLNPAVGEISRVVR